MALPETSYNDESLPSTDWQSAGSYVDDDYIDDGYFENPEEATTTWTDE